MFFIKCYTKRTKSDKIRTREFLNKRGMNIPDGTGGVLMKNLFTKVQNRKTGSARALSCLLVFLVVFLCFNWPMQAHAQERIIKVGYINQGNFIEENYGNYNGYAVEYLNKISEITGWQYEYIEDTWENCLAKIETGEYDLVCMAQYTDERAEKFLYSDIPLGYDFTILYADENSDIYFEDYEAMDGEKVGLLNASRMSDNFFDIAKEHDMEFEPVYYNTEKEIMEALQRGEVKLAAVGSLYGNSHVKAVGKYGASPFYCITGKQNVDLMDELNMALTQIKLEYPMIEAELTEKYYGDGRISSSPLFTKEEQEYIENAQPITIKLMLGSQPLSYLEDGEPSGIFVNYLKLLSQKSGLEFDIQLQSSPITMDEETVKIQEENYLMLRAKRALENNEAGEKLIHTNTLFSTRLSYVKDKNEVGDELPSDAVFAVTKEMGYIETLLQATGQDYSVSYYGSTAECLEAVIDDEADVAIQDAYMITYLMQKPKYADKLVECPGDDFYNGMCLIASSEQQMLINVLNKTIHHITSDEQEDIVTMELILNPYEQGLGDLLYKYWLPILIIVLVLIIGFLIYTSLMRGMTDLKLQKQESEILQKKVQIDPVSKAYNRAYFYEKAKEMIKNSTEEMCIVMMDIMNFKVVNDLYGMANGDRLLSQIARELEKLGQDKEFIVSRFSGDHFYMCMKKSDFENIIFPKKFKTSLGNMDVNVTYGVFFVDEQKDVPINIMCDRASLAAHNKEARVVDYVRYYSDAERTKILKEQEIENEMEHALDSRQFCVFVQPKYDLSKEKIVGGEALVRWKHPQKGMIPPFEFIGVFEKNGFIIKLDYFVWEETCKLLSKLKKEGYGGYPISINVSRAHFYGKELIGKLQSLVEKYDLEPQELELEITETICAEDPEIIYKKVRQLQEAGFKVAMDDFGSGYSSLNMLKEMPLDIIKMDLKFLDGGDNEEKSHYILQTLISLAQNMKLLVVVEGVETKVQVEFLRGIGSYYAQGYYFSKPVESATYESMLKENKG